MKVIELCTKAIQNRLYTIRFIAAFGSYMSKTLKTVNFCKKNEQIFVLNGQSFAKSEFSRHIEYDLLKNIRTTSIPKIRKIHSGVWKLEVKNSQNCQFWPKMALNGPNLAISEFSQHIEYDFLKEDHKNNFHTKN